MNRILEPELMIDIDQCQAFDQAHSRQRELACLQLLFKLCTPKGVAIDVGCGSGTYADLLKQKFVFERIDAIDGSACMIDLAKHKYGHQRDINWINQTLATVKNRYDFIFCMDSLHHMPTLDTLFASRIMTTGTEIFVMDHVRPNGVDQARDLVNKFAMIDNQTYRDDFFNSLCAAYTKTEVTSYLAIKHPGLRVKIVGRDLKFIVIYGKV